MTEDERDLVAVAALLDQRVAWVSAELGTLLERAHELTPHAREALLAVCADVAGVLERAKHGGRTH